MPAESLDVKHASTRTPRLALGTVQFGLAYGVAGRAEPIPETEVTTLLRRAWDLGIDTLDTAAAYGSIEGRLARLMGDLEFRVISKLPAMQGNLSPADAASAAAEAFETSRRHLGPRLKALMFHNADDLQSPQGRAAWNALVPRARDAGVVLGASGYDPQAVARLAADLEIGIAQLPGNALDQRLAAVAWPATVELHLRSAFLQGLLLMPAADAQRRVPAAAPAIGQWQDWCRIHDMPPIRAALSVIKGWPVVGRCVVGVDNLGQLEEIAMQWELAEAIHAPELAVNQPQAVDPRLWPPKRLD